jgi:GTPase
MRTFPAENNPGIDQIAVPEKSLVIGIRSSRQSQEDADQSCSELKALVETAGATVAGEIFCHVKQIRVGTYIGSGKVLEIAEFIKENSIEIAVVDVPLSPPQQRNLEKAWNVRVIDRTGVILDIFAARAATREGQLQVEFAQLEYRLPRLTRMWEHLGRLGAGIGTRGPGETQLEVDRRRIRARLDKLKQELLLIEKRRNLQRKNRKRSGIISIALVGYTNAGKSTLLNLLTGADVVVKDQLFVTLDPTIRQLLLPNNQTVILSDTVGFISRLPHELVAAFHATLEEVVQADLLLHVIDSASPHREEQIRDVEAVLVELGIENTPVIHVYNKIDQSKEWAPGEISSLPESVAVSACMNQGIDALLQMIVRFQNSREIPATLFIPYKDSSVIATIRENCEIVQELFEAEGTRLHILAKHALINKYRGFVEADSNP